MKKAKAGEVENGTYSSVTGVELAGKKSKQSDGESVEPSEDEEDVSEEESSEEEGEDEEEGGRVFKDSHRPRDESPNSRKVRLEIMTSLDSLHFDSLQDRKKAVKEAQAAKRKEKMKKHVKKRKEKVGRQKK